MGAEQSKQDQQDDWEQRKKNREESSMGAGAALAVGAAVGSALLGVALSLYRSSGSDDRIDHQNQITNHRQKTTLKIMSYNVWSQENCELDRRMEAIGKLVDEHSPHFICFQEITPAIFNYFSQSNWWKNYYCSMSHEDAKNKQYFCILLSKFHPENTTRKPLGYISRVGREISLIEVIVGNELLVVATSHLKSRCADPSVPNGQYHQNGKERMEQAKQALIILENYPNVIFCGDMNWDEDKDGKFPLPRGWVDAWNQLRPDEKGFTYDTKTNPMLLGRLPVRKRFDRSLCKSNSFIPNRIEIIGKDAIPEATFKSKKKELPVLPSDHYGLILTICKYQ